MPLKNALDIISATLFSSNIVIIDEEFDNEIIDDEESTNE